MLFTVIVLAVGTAYSRLALLSFHPYIYLSLFASENMMDTYFTVI